MTDKKYSTIISMCMITALLASAAGLLLEIYAVHVRTDNIIARSAFIVASLAITAGIMILGDYVGERKLFAAHHLALLCFMIAFSATLQTLGQYAALENTEHKSDNTNRYINALEAEKRQLEQSIATYNAYDMPTKAKPAQARLAEINKSMGSLYAQSSVKFGDTLTPFAEKLGISQEAIKAFLTASLAIILSALPFFLMLVAYSKKPVHSQSSLVRKRPEPSTGGGSRQSTKPDCPSPSPTRTKKKRTSPTRNDQTDNQIITKLTEWKRDNPGKPIKSESELREILGIGYSRVQRMKRAGIDLMDIAKSNQKIRAVK